MRTRSIQSALWSLAAGTVLAVLASAQGQPDFSKVEIKTTKVSNNFYTLEGQGGTIGVLAGPDGVLLVDSQFAPLTQKIMAAIRQISGGPIRFLVNTHVHGDHTGGNVNFGAMGVVIFARDELRNRLIRPSPTASGAPGVPAPAAALPAVTYAGRVTWHMNGEDVELIAIPRAHTDGDTIVRFPANDIIMTGDYFRSVGFPNIDRNNGGTLNGMVDGLGRLIGMAGPNTKIIPGHGPTVDRTAVTAHRDMLLAVRDRVSKLIEQGKTLEEAVAAKPAADYVAKVAQPGANPGAVEDRFIGQVYAELKAAR